MDESYENHVHKFLPRWEADFFLAYQKASGPSAGKDKVKFHRLKTKLVNNMIKRWKDPRDKPE